MRNHTIGALVVLASVVLLGSRFAEAGHVLLARESSISAVGWSDGGEFSFTDGSRDFASFADLVNAEDAGVAGADVSANQNSHPALKDGAFAGAYAEGSANAATGVDADGRNDDDFAEAFSQFDLTFEVLGAPSLVRFGGSLGVTGNATTVMTLVNETTGEPVVNDEVMAGAGEGQSITHDRVLDPGVYQLSITATASGAGEAGEPSSAYYAMNVSLATPANNVNPIPLPPAVASAITLLAAMAACRLRGAIARA